MGNPEVDFAREIRCAVVFALIAGALVAALAVLRARGIVEDQSEAHAILAFALGLTASCAVASGLTFLIRLRHFLLLVSLGTLLVAAGAIVAGLGPAEIMAKLVFGAATGLWISLMLTSVAQVMLISVLIILVDFYSVFMGPTKKMVESGGPWLEYLTISLPTFGIEATSRLGVSDIIFFSLFIGCTLCFRLRRITTALAMSLSLVLTMVVGVTLELGVPALPLLSIAFLIANADLLYQRFVEEPGAGAP